MRQDAWDNPALVERLRALWAEGHSTAEIGRRLGMTKNAIVGKAKRLNLPARPSPIVRGRAPRDPAQSRGDKRVLNVPRRTLAPLVALQSPIAAMFAEAARELRVEARPAQPKHVAPSRPCCWPLWDGAPTHEYCGADGLPGRPYCDAHHGIAYARVDKGADLARWIRGGGGNAAGIGFV